MIHFCVFPETTLFEFRRFVRFCGVLGYTHFIPEFWVSLKYDALKELAAFPGGKLLILPIPRVASPEPDLTPYREIIRAEAAAFPSIPMRDGYDFFPAKAELYIDGTHPNDAGAKIYADFLTKTIQQGA